MLYNQSFWSDAEIQIRGLKLAIMDCGITGMSIFPQIVAVDFNFNGIQRVINMIIGDQLRNRKFIIVTPVENSDQIADDQFSKIRFWINNVPPKEFAGKAGGASQFSFPINSLARARNALARAHYAPNPEEIRRAVYKKYPQLKAHFESHHHEKAMPS